MYNKKRRPLIRRLGRFFRRTHFLLIGRRRYNRLTIEQVCGKPVLVLPEVFNPVLFRTGAFLAEFLDRGRISESSTVLELGTGTGIGAIVCADRATRVVAVDISAQAVRCARINALLNGVGEKIEIRESDLFQSLEGQRFDVVVFNPPYFRGDPRNDRDRALWSKDVVERFAGQLGSHLTDKGFGLVLLSTDGPVDEFLHAFDFCDLCYEVVAEKDLVTEVILILRLLPRMNTDV